MLIERIQFRLNFFNVRLRDYLVAGDRYFTSQIKNPVLASTQETSHWCEAWLFRIDKLFHKKTYPAIKLINTTNGLNSAVVFVCPGTVAKSCFALVAGACVNFAESFSHLTFLVVIARPSGLLSLSSN